MFRKNEDVPKFKTQVRDKMNKSLENFSSATASQLLNEDNDGDDVPMERALEQVGGRGKFQFGLNEL